MKKIILIILIYTGSIYAIDVAPTANIISSYTLKKNNVFIKTNLNLVSDNLDIFGIINDNNGNSDSHGSIGDLNGLALSLGYGFEEHISFFYNLELLNLDYAGEDLKNSYQDIFIKLNLYNNPSAVLETFSTDIGIMRNSSNDLVITGSNLGINKMSNMSDNSFYIRTITGTKIKSSILDFFLGIKYTKINTQLDSKSYSRNEFALNSGFQYTLELGRYIIETGYEYIKLFSRDIDSVDDINHIFNLSISYAINNQLIIFIGSKLFNHQFNGIIPYLHNEKTINTFDQRYGYGSVGFVYNFNI
jgi:hypothetical protein